MASDWPKLVMHDDCIRPQASLCLYQLCIFSLRPTVLKVCFAVFEKRKMKIDIVSQIYASKFIRRTGRTNILVLLGIAYINTNSLFI